MILWQTLQPSLRAMIVWCWFSACNFPGFWELMRLCWNKTNKPLQSGITSWFEVIKDLLAKGAVVESLDLKEAPDILAQARFAGDTSSLFYPAQAFTRPFLWKTVIRSRKEQTLKHRCCQRRSLDDLAQSWLIWQIQQLSSGKKQLKSSGCV